MKKKINIGMIGGGLMCKQHSAAFGMMPVCASDRADWIPVRKVICDVTKEIASKAADRYQWEEFSDDWKAMVARDDIDLVDIATPTNLHKEMAIEAAKQGKMIYCEKPMALNAAECLEMYEAAKAAGVPNAVGFNKRRWPAIQFAKKLIEEGTIGDIIYIRGRFLAAQMLDPTIPICWRFKKSMTGPGAIAESGSHLIDMIRYLVGEYESVVGVVQTTIKERPLPVEGKDFYSELKITADTPMGSVETDDLTIGLAKMRGGALAVFENSAMSSGEGNDMGFEIYGTRGSIRWQEQYANELQLCEQSAPGDRRGFKTIECGAPSHPYGDLLYGGTYFGLGLAENKMLDLYEFIDHANRGEPCTPNFYDGYRCMQVIDALVESSEKGIWVKIPE